MRLLLTRGRSYEEWMKLLPHYPKIFILLMALVFLVLYLPGFIFFEDMFIIPLVGNLTGSFISSWIESISIMVYYAIAFFVIHICRNFLKRWMPFFMALVDCTIIISHHNKFPKIPGDKPPELTIKYTKYHICFMVLIFYVFLSYVILMPRGIIELKNFLFV